MSTDVRDSAYSWIVAVAGCLMYFIMYGLGRTSGLLFVETLRYFNTDRGTASFPFSLGVALRYLAGPLAGYLASILGIRFMIMAGSILASVGVGGCFLAENVAAIAVLWGCLFGLGSGISSTQLPQVNNLYFNKHLTKANGISYSGAAIAGFVLPPLMGGFLHQYGLRGAYLLLSGIALHSIPAAILLKEPVSDEMIVKESKKIKIEIPEEVQTEYIRKLSDISVLYDHTRNITRKISSAKGTQELINDLLPVNECEETANINIILEEDNTSMSGKTSSFSFSGNSSSIRGKSNSLSYSEMILNTLNVTQDVVAINLQNMTESLSNIKEGETLNINPDERYVPGSGSLSRSSLKSFSNTEIIQNLNAMQDSVAVNVQNMLLPFKRNKTHSLSNIKENEALNIQDIENTEDNSVPTTEPFSIVSKYSLKHTDGSRERRETSISFSNSESISQNNLDPPKGVFYIECLETNEIPSHQVKTSCMDNFSIFWDIKFFLISFTASINGFYCFVLPAILVDYSNDKGISVADSTKLMVSFSICDTIGRLGFGWVTDSKYMTRANFCALCFLVLSVCLACFVWFSGLVPMYLILSILGLCLGAHTPVPTGLIAEYIPQDQHTIANASFDILGVPFLLSTSSMIGYFRDRLGSYDLFVYLLCAISFLCCVMMVALQYIGANKKNKEEDVPKG